MSPFAIPRRWLKFLVAILLVVTPLVSQVLERRVVETHLPRAIEEVVRKRNLDPQTLDRVKRTLLPRDSTTWNKEQATGRLAEAMKRKDFFLTKESDGFKIHLTHPEDLDPTVALRTSGNFVDSLSSVTRRYQVLDEIVRPKSTDLGHDDLRVYLRDAVKLVDYDDVTKSFDPDLSVEAVTLPQETNLLRLYGGESKAIGRFFFCCVFRATIDAALARQHGGLQILVRRERAGHPSGQFAPAPGYCQAPCRDACDCRNRGRQLPRSSSTRAGLRNVGTRLHE